MSNPNESDFGGTDHEMYKAPAGQGIEAPLAQETGGPAEMSVFDGAGNESVIVMGEDEDGRRVQGGGPDRESALAEGGGDTLLTDQFSPGIPTEQGGKG
ncbi:MAG: hypothetical protein M3Q48_09240 [Actinomycetota bacterium]|nr:hypothetical protein [Actinomycetota bacterium]